MIKKLRKDQKITQKELAEKCNMTQGYLSRLEKKYFNPTIRQIICLATQLKTNALHLASWFVYKELEQQSQNMEFEEYQEDEEE